MGCRSSKSSQLKERSTPPAEGFQDASDFVFGDFVVSAGQPHSVKKGSEDAQAPDKKEQVEKTTASEIIKEAMQMPLEPQPEETQRALMMYRRIHNEAVRNGEASQCVPIVALQTMYDKFTESVAVRFNERLTFWNLKPSEFQKLWAEKDAAVQTDPVFKDLYVCKKEIESFDCFCAFVQNGGPPPPPPPPSETDFPTRLEQRCEDLDAIVDDPREILMYWDTENVAPDPVAEQSACTLRDYIREKNIGNPVSVHIEAYFCELPQRQMWGLRLAGITMIACCNIKKEEVDRQMERRIRRETTRTTPDKTIFVIVSGDGDFNQVVEDVAKAGFRVHLITPRPTSSVHRFEGVSVWTGFSFRGAARPKARTPVKKHSGAQKHSYEGTGTVAVRSEALVFDNADELVSVVTPPPAPDRVHSRSREALTFEDDDDCVF